MKKGNGDEMRKRLIIGAVVLAILMILIFYVNFNQVKEYNWQDDGIVLMQHETEKTYACFGCNVPKGSGPAMCIDPAPVMIPAEETEERYCGDDFEVIEK